LKKQRILIVDDNPTNRAICQDLFHDEYCLDEAHDGYEALQRIETVTPDVILLDVMMPGIDGYEVCRRIKSNPTTQDIPVIMVSAKGQINEIIHGYESLADDYVVKPFVNSELKARVRAMLRLKSALDELHAAYRMLHERTQKLEEANERLKELDKIKGAFTAMLVHDLRSPLSVVQVALQMLTSHKIISQPEYQALVQESLGSCNELFDLTGDLMEVFRTEAAEMVLNRSMCRVDHLVEEVHRQTAVLGIKKNIQVNLKVQENIPELSIDPAKMQRAVNNLLHNAIKFTPRGGAVSIVVSKLASDPEGTSAELSIQITDSGEGIPPEGLAHIFDPYYQASTKHAGIGSGLGLAIVKKVVAAHGGEVKVQSTIGQGSTFTIVLPIEQASPGCDKIK
jgi:two-component system sensor histidine kinase/response regulator